MTLTERDFVEIFARHGINQGDAVGAYKAYSKVQSEKALLGQGISDELAKKQTELLAAAMAKSQRRTLKGLFSRLFGK